MRFLAPISAGDLADRISILRLKLVNIENPEKRKNISLELGLVQAAWDQGIAETQHPMTLKSMLDKLDKANQQIWKLEDGARIPKYSTDETDYLTGADKRSMAMMLRNITRWNDTRAVLKRTISHLLESDIIEEKSHRA